MKIINKILVFFKNKLKKFRRKKNSQYENIYPLF